MDNSGNGYYIQILRRGCENRYLMTLRTFKESQSHPGYVVGSETHFANARSILAVSIVPFRRAHAIDFLVNRLLVRMPTRLAFANANLLNMAYADSDFCTLLQTFVVLNDGAGVNLASRLLYRAPFPDNLNGTDFCPEFLEKCQPRLRIYLLGGRPTVVSRAASAIASQWPRHEIVGIQHGFFEPSEFARIREEMVLARPDIVFVAMGNGRQERVVNDLVPLCAPFACGVGAWFDFLAGEVPRAPRILQMAGAEWVYRLMLEPRRLWKRYIIGNPLFLWRVFKQRIKGAYRNA